MGPLGEIGQRLSRGTPAGRAVIDRQGRSCPGSSRRAIGVSRRPKAYPVWQSDRSLHAVTPRRCSDWRDSYSPHGSSSFFGKADRAPQNLCRSSRHRHRERPAVQRIEERNAELREALEHQTATSEVLGIISRSPTDVQPVLDAIVESAARVCGIDDLVLRLREGNSLVSRAHFGPIPVRARRDQY